METSADNTDLTSPYAAQITADLERNPAEHERLSSDVTALFYRVLRVFHDGPGETLSLRWRSDAVA